MVICTFLSAPIMYVSAWLLTITCSDPQVVMTALQNVSLDISIVSFIGLVSRNSTVNSEKKHVTDHFCFYLNRVQNKLRAE